MPMRPRNQTSEPSGIWYFWWNKINNWPSPICYTRRIWSDRSHGQFLEDLHCGGPRGLTYDVSSLISVIQRGFYSRAFLSTACFYKNIVIYPRFASEQSSNDKFDKELHQGIVNRILLTRSQRSALSLVVTARRIVRRIIEVPLDVLSGNCSAACEPSPYVLPVGHAWMRRAHRGVISRAGHTFRNGPKNNRHNVLYMIRSVCNCRVWTYTKSTPMLYNLY